MKKYIPISLALSSLLFAASVFADQLRFTSDVVSSNTAGGPSPMASFTNSTGTTPTSTVVVLPKTMAVRDLKTGDVVYLPSPRNSVFRVVNVTPGADGGLLVDVEDTFLSMKSGKSSTTTTTTILPSSTTTTPSTTIVPAPATPSSSSSSTTITTPSSPSSSSSSTTTTPVSPTSSSSTTTTPSTSMSPSMTTPTTSTSPSRSGSY